MQTDKIILFGAGGFGREIYSYLVDMGQSRAVTFMVDDEYFNNQPNTIKFSDFNIENHYVLICVGDPIQRERIVNKFPENTKWYTFIHESAYIGSDVSIEDGTIICPGVILTTNIILGKHAHLNILSTIGHDCIIGDYFTTAPGGKVSGNCDIGDRVYLGTNASIKQKIIVTNDVTIGLNGGVVKNINESGIYGGVPVKKLK